MEISKGHPRSLSPSSSTHARTSDRATEERKELQRAIEETEKQIDDTHRQGEQEVERLRENYASQTETQMARQEDELERQRLKGIEALRELQQQQQNEINRLKREGEQEIEKLRNYYSNTTEKAERDGEQKLKKIEHEQFLGSEANRTKDAFFREEMKKSQAHEMARDQENHKQRLNELQTSAKKEYATARSATAQATQDANEKFDGKYKAVVDEQNKLLNKVYTDASNKLKEIREDTSRKLDAYESRQKDPFYQLIDMGIDVEEKEGFYRITARVPEHEQKNISISVKGNNVVLAGHRRSEEKQELEPGRQMATASFQSFHESIPLTAPIEAKALQREFDGETLIVTVPKKQQTVVYKPHRAPMPKHEHPAQTPKFPDDLTTTRDSGKTKRT